MRIPTDPARGGLAVYVTSHGFGHLNRTAAVLNHVPARVPVTVRSDSSLFGNWRERLKRPAEMKPYVSDIGAVNPPGDSAATDCAATLELAARCHAQAMERLDDEVGWLREQGIAAVLCDAPAVPLLAARRALVPGFLMSNFTWADIYAPYAKAKGGEALRLVADLRRLYRQASAIFRIQPALKMSWLSPVIDSGMVVNGGRDRRGELRRLFGLTRAPNIGRYGQSDLDWPRLERLAPQGVHFLSYHSAPGGSLSNLHVVPSADWPGGDLIASSDAIVAKAGYGAACEAMASGTPIIYPPRRGFAEYRALDRALRSWGGGVPISSSVFRALKLERALQHAFQIKPGPPPFRTDGAERIAEHLTRLCRPSQDRNDSAVAF
jgi:hypothetical protein